METDWYLVATLLLAAVVFVFWYIVLSAMMRGRKPFDYAVLFGLGSLLLYCFIDQVMCSPGRSFGVLALAVFMYFARRREIARSGGVECSQSRSSDRQQQ